MVYDKSMTRLPRQFNRMFGTIACLLGLLLAMGQGEPERAQPAGAGGRGGGDAFVAGQALQPAHQKAVIIRLDAPVDDMMRKSIERRLDIARKAGCTLAVFEIDTYGGQVTSALDISKLIKELPGQHQMNTVAWVHRKAISGGALISAACQQIVMSSQSSIGDCAPIMVTGDGLVPIPDTERAKFASPITQEFDNSAQVNGYNNTLFQAMVVVTLEVHEVRNATTGETRFVDTPAKDKLLNEEVARPDGTKEKPWGLIRTVDDDKSLLTIGAPEALAMKLSRATIDTEEALRGALNIRAEPMVLGFNWAERATVFLTNWPIRLLLFVAMLVFAWVEISHPGVSVAGITALICLVLLVGAPFLTGLAQVWEVALIVIGLGIIVTDFVLFGGIGMLAIPGFILMAIGMVASFVPLEPGSGWFPTMASTWVAVQKGLGVLVGGCILALGTFYFLSRYLYLTPGFSRLQLAPSGIAPSGAGKALGVTQVRDALDLPADEAVFVGALGVASTDLRPSGKARFGEHLVNVMSDGLYIGQKQEVEVIEVSGMRVVVRRHTSPPAASPPNVPPTSPAVAFPADASRPISEQMGGMAGGDYGLPGLSGEGRDVGGKPPEGQA
jgi:membrane-bound serine protease (ClpP class)